MQVPDFSTLQPVGGALGGGSSAPDFSTLQPVSSVPDVSVPPEQSIGSKIANFLGGNIASQFKSGIGQIKNAFATDTSGNASPLQGAEAGLSALSGVASVITSPLAPLFAPVKGAINAVANGYTAADGSHVGGIGDIPAVQKFAQTPAAGTVERIATDAANAGNVAGTILGANEAVDAAPAIGDAVAKGANAVADTATKIATTPTFVDRWVNGEAPPTDAETASGILDNYNTAVKPSISGKTGTGQFDAYNNNVVNAVKTITANKDNLSFQNDDGTTITGQLPTNRAQFADALDQTKTAIFQQYDALAKAAGDKGITVDLKPATDSLNDVINNEALKITNPAAIEYAKGIQERLQNPDGTPRAITPDVAQQVIQSYNASLKAFYKNPTYDSASRAAIDAGVVSEIRKSLDDSITKSQVPTGINVGDTVNVKGSDGTVLSENAKVNDVQTHTDGTQYVRVEGSNSYTPIDNIEKTGGEPNANAQSYQGLKNQYGALSSIEKDVNKSAIMQAKQTGTNTAGLGKYIDVFSGGDMVSGLLSLNPALFAKGVAQSGISHFFQWLNSPDRAVGNMFNVADKSVNSNVVQPDESGGGQ